MRERSGKPKYGPGHKSPNAGAERQPPGTVRSPRAHKALQEARAGLLGPPQRPPGCRRHPRPVATIGGIRLAGRMACAPSDSRGDEQGREKGWPMPKLSVDAAVAEFYKLLHEELTRRGIEPVMRPHHYVPDTSAQAEAVRFQLAELLLRLACPELRRCKDQRCRRGGLCRHLADMHMRQRPQVAPPVARRTPGADAARHAMWVFMNIEAGQRRLDRGGGLGVVEIG